MKKGWSIVKLGDVCDIISGRNQKAVECPVGSYPIYGSGGLMGHATDYLCEAGATVIGRKGSINNPIYVQSRFWNVDTAFGLLPKPCYDSKLFYYFCLSFDFSKMNKGTTIPSLVKSDLLQIAIPFIGSISEQQRIAKVLDAAFAKIDSLKDISERNYLESKQLFQLSLEKVLSPREDWVIKELIDVVDAGSCISYGIVQPGEDTPGGVPIVRPVDLKEETLTSSSGFKRTRKEISDSYKRSILKGKEILLSVRGSTGVVSCSSPQLSGCNTTRGIVPLSIADDVDRKYVFYVIKSDSCQQFIKLHTNGTTLKQINIADVKRIPIPLAPIKERSSIVESLDVLHGKCNALQLCFERTAVLCDDLKRALLKSAFNGEL